MLRGGQLHAEGQRRREHQDVGEVEVSAQKDGGEEEVHGCGTGP